MHLETVPVRTLVDTYFEPMKNNSVLKNGMKLSMYEVDGIFIVTIDKDATEGCTATAFLDKSHALDFIEAHGVKVRDADD